MLFSYYLNELASTSLETLSTYNVLRLKKVNTTVFLSHKLLLRFCWGFFFSVFVLVGLLGYFYFLLKDCFKISSIFCS